MDFKPRKLPVFNRVERKAATAPMTADRKAVCQWNGAEAKKGNAIVCEGLGYEGKAAEIRKGDALTFSLWQSENGLGRGGYPVTSQPSGAGR